MNAILRSHSVVPPLVVLATTLLTSTLIAAPLNFQVNLVPGGSSRGHILAGATLQLNLSWDAAAIPPIAHDNRETRWGFENTAGSLTVTGSANSDGVYNASFSNTYLGKGAGWVTSSYSSWDSLDFPTMHFEIGGRKVRTGWLQAQFANSFFTPPGPFMPKAFTSAETTWGVLDFFVTAPNGIGDGFLYAKIASGSATQVPEPTALATASFALSLVAFRRRK